VIKLKTFHRKLYGFTVSTMTWVTVPEYLCSKWPRMCSLCRYSQFLIHDFKYLDFERTWWTLFQKRTMR